MRVKLKQVCAQVSASQPVPHHVERGRLLRNEQHGLPGVQRAHRSCSRSSGSCPCREGRRSRTTGRRARPRWRPAATRRRPGPPGWSPGGAAVDLVLGNLVETQAAVRPGRPAKPPGPPPPGAPRPGPRGRAGPGTSPRSRRRSTPARRSSLTCQPSSDRDRVADGGQERAQRHLLQVVRGRQRDPAGGELPAQRRVDDRVILGRLQHRRLPRRGGHQPGLAPAAAGSCTGSCPRLPRSGRRRLGTGPAAPVEVLLVRSPRERPQRGSEILGSVASVSRMSAAGGGATGSRGRRPCAGPLGAHPFCPGQPAVSPPRLVPAPRDRNVNVPPARRRERTSLGAGRTGPIMPVRLGLRLSSRLAAVRPMRLSRQPPIRSADQRLPVG